MRVWGVYAYAFEEKHHGVFVWGEKWFFFYLTENFFILFSCVVKINKIIYCHGSQCSAPCSSLKSYKWIIFLFFWNALIFFFLYDWFHFFTHEIIFYWILLRTIWREKEGENVWHWFLSLFFNATIWSILLCCVSLLKRWI